MTNMKQGGKARKKNMKFSRRWRFKTRSSELWPHVVLW